VIENGSNSWEGKVFPIPSITTPSLSIFGREPDLKGIWRTGWRVQNNWSSIGIYDVPVRLVLQPYRKAADVIEASDLEYTILRPTWFTSTDEVDYETTRKGEPERGSAISQKSLSTLIARIIESPDQYIRENLGVNKPNS